MATDTLRNRRKKKKQEERKRKAEESDASSEEVSDDEGGKFRSNSGYTREGVIVNSYFTLLLLSSFLYFTHAWNKNTTDINFGLCFSLFCPIFSRYNTYVTLTGFSFMLGTHILSGFPEVEANTIFILQYVACILALLPEGFKFRYRSECLKPVTQAVGMMFVMYFFFLGFHKLNSAWFGGYVHSCSLNTTNYFYRLLHHHTERKYANAWKKMRLAYLFSPSVRGFVDTYYTHFCFVQPTYELLTAAALFRRKGSRAALIFASFGFYYYFYVNIDEHIAQDFMPARNYGILINFMAAMYLLSGNDLREENDFKEYAWMGDFSGADGFVLKGVVFNFAILVLGVVGVILNIYTWEAYTWARTITAIAFYCIFVLRHLFTNYDWIGVDVKPKSIASYVLIALCLLQFGGCYIGLSTAGNLSGMSNLLVEGNDGNHLLLGGGFKLFNFQDDVVTIRDFHFGKWYNFWHGMPQSKRVHIGGGDHMLTHLKHPKIDWHDLDIRNRLDHGITIYRETHDGPMPRNLQKTTQVGANSYQYIHGWSSWRLWFTKSGTDEFLGPKRPMLIHEECPRHELLDALTEVCMMKAPLLEDGVEEDFFPEEPKSIFMTIPRIGFDKLLHGYMLKNFTDPADAIIPMRIEYGGELYDVEDILLTDEFSQPKYPILSRLLDFKGWFANSTKRCDYY